MNELEQINRYIERTRMSNGKAYRMNLVDIVAMAMNAKDDPWEMLRLAFDYGRAKGYRAARAEAKKEAF